MASTRTDFLASESNARTAPDPKALQAAISFIQPSVQPSGNPETDTSSEQKTPRKEQSLARPPDSGYASFPNTPETIFSPKGGRKRLKPFDKHIPHTAEARFYDWKVLFRSQLRDIFIKNNAAGTDMLMRLRWLGTCEDDAKLYLVFQCSTKLASPLKRFLDHKHVRDQCQPQFECLVVPSPPKRLYGSSPQLVWKATNLFGPLNFHLKSTLCGTPILVQNVENETSLATIGGVILVETPAWSYLCCMTAGHVTSGSPPAATESTDDNKSRNDGLAELKGDSMDTMEDEFTFELEDLYEICKPPITARNLPTQGGSMGHILKADTISMNKLQCEIFDTSEDFDWALVELHPNPRYLPNTIEGPFGTLHLTQSPQGCPHWGETEILVISGQSGILTGRIRFCDSEMLFSGCSGFTELHHVTFERKSEHQSLLLRPGDSGSWVVDSRTGYVYGHIVEVDIFGDAYVVPLEQSLEDIRKRLKARRVTLPTSSEVLALAGTATEAAAADSGYASLDTSPVPLSFNGRNSIKRQRRC